MLNLTLNRITSQIPNVETGKKQLINLENVNKMILSPPISIEKLKDLLTNLFIKKEELIIEQKEVIDFDSIYAFVDWYLPKREEFSEKQRVPLDSLVEARNSIFKGCGCRKAQRERAANNYFKLFWENNSNNDLLPTIIKISNSNKIKFGDFLFYPN